MSEVPFSELFVCLSVFISIIAFLSSCFSFRFHFFDCFVCILSNGNYYFLDLHTFLPLVHVNPFVLVRVSGSVFRIICLSFRFHFCCHFFRFLFPSSFRKYHPAKGFSFDSRSMHQNVTLGLKRHFVISTNTKQNKN